MKLHARVFGMAAGATAAVLFALCALAVAVAPEATTAFAGYLIHTDLSGIQSTLTFGSFVGGLLLWSVGAGITFGLTATIYNRLIGLGARAPVGAAHPAVA